MLSPFNVQLGSSIKYKSKSFSFCQYYGLSQMAKASQLEVSQLIFSVACIDKF